jgi:DNA-3-methyladenine glycosylase
MSKLSTAFFERDVVAVARDLVGCVLEVTGDDGVVCSGRIVEVEAYGGEDDPASHAGRGRTPRSAIMFGPPAVAYVYLIYGMHHCLNVVAGPEGTPGAVLVRAIEPISGRGIMAERRGLDPAACRDREIAAGPGRLCRAMGVDLGWNGSRLNAGKGIAVLAAEALVEPAATPRIGISRAVDRPWRFCDTASGCLSV